MSSQQVELKLNEVSVAQRPASFAIHTIRSETRTVMNTQYNAIPVQAGNGRGGAMLASRADGGLPQI